MFKGIMTENIIHGLRKMCQSTRKAPPARRLQRITIIIVFHTVQRIIKSRKGLDELKSLRKMCGSKTP